MTRSGRGAAAWLAVALLGFSANALGAGVLYGEPKVWISLGELDALPTQGPAWDAVVARSADPLGTPSLANQDDPANVTTLALALYAARTRDAAAAERVRRICLGVIGTERGARSLAVGRELIGYVIAADLVGFAPSDDAVFRNWLSAVRTESFEGRTLRSTDEDRPNNWGTHAGATRLAIAVYLGDRAEIERVADVFRGWVGERDAWQGFKFGEAWWQPEGSLRYGINPVGAIRDGHSIDGVLPDDQRRGGPFQWPPPKEPYVYEALQGAVSQALMLERQGYPAWSWGDRALLRAFRWLHDEAKFPAEGDDTWIPYVINHAYGTHFPAPMPSHPGKGVGFTDWTLAGPDDASASRDPVPIPPPAVAVD